MRGVRERSALLNDAEAGTAAPDPDANPNATGAASGRARRAAALTAASAIAAQAAVRGVKRGDNRGLPGPLGNPLGTSLAVGSPLGVPQRAGSLPAADGSDGFDPLTTPVTKGRRTARRPFRGSGRSAPPCPMLLQTMCACTCWGVLQSTNRVLYVRAADAMY